MSCLGPEVSGKQENRRGKLGHITHRELAACGQSCKQWGIQKSQRSEETTAPGILQKAQLSQTMEQFWSVSMRKIQWFTNCNIKFMVIKWSNNMQRFVYQKIRRNWNMGFLLRPLKGCYFHYHCTTKAVVQAPVCRREGNLEFSFYLVPILSETSPSSKGILCALPHPINIFESQHAN